LKKKDWGNMAYRVNHCGIVVLAGGQSSRLGSPKQLLPYKESTLIRHAATVALAANCGPVLIVTGSNEDAVTKAIEGLGVVVSTNQGWKEGMAASLRVGLKAMVERFPETDGIIFMVCDQPFVTKSLLLCLIETQQTTGKAVTACSYLDKKGTPALFHSSFFEKLMELKGDKGARMLIAAHPDEVADVPFEEGAIDIDTVDDYKRLLNGLNKVL
jgi:molybdenum cofactor cytidylyltransferase